MNPDTRNLIAAICLSMSVLIGYQILFGEPNQQNVKKEQQIVDKNNEPSIELPKGNDTSLTEDCLLYTSPSPRDVHLSRMPSSA